MREFSRAEKIAIAAEADRLTGITYEEPDDFQVMEFDRALRIGDDGHDPAEDWYAFVYQRAKELSGRPVVVCLCGSTRFYKQFQQANYSETMAGRIVLSVGFYPHAPEVHGEGVGCSPEQKVALDELHKRKIDLADEVLVLNVGGYVGESTASEIKYALTHGKRVRYLEPLC